VNDGSHKNKRPSAGIAELRSRNHRSMHGYAVFDRLAGFIGVEAVFQYITENTMESVADLKAKWNDAIGTPTDRLKKCPPRQSRRTRLRGETGGGLPKSLIARLISRVRHRRRTRTQAISASSNHLWDLKRGCIGATDGRRSRSRGSEYVCQMTSVLHSSEHRGGPTTVAGRSRGFITVW